MKIETWIFGICSVFFARGDAGLLARSAATGPAPRALVMTFLLITLITFYLGFHARQIGSRRPPEDRKDGEIAEGAGELGFFPPYSWWPFWCGLCLATMALGVAIGWWLFIIGAVLGALALSGLIFEYYRGRARPLSRVGPLHRGVTPSRGREQEHVRPAACRYAALLPCQVSSPCFPVSGVPMSTRSLPYTPVPGRCRPDTRRW